MVAGVSFREIALSRFARTSFVITAFLSVFFLLSQVHAAGSGTSAAPFLTLGLGSRAQGLANGVVALADDAAASYFNPAGLSSTRREMILSHSLWFQDIALSQLALSIPLSNSPLPPGGEGRGVRRWAIGLHATRLGVEGMEKRSSETANPEGSFGAEDVSIGFSLARSLGASASLGATTKLVQQRISGTTGRTFAFDLGGRYRFSGLPVQAGLAVRNIGPGLKLGSETYPLPFSVHAGLAYVAPLTVVAEAGRSRGGLSEFKFGAEQWLGDSFALRGGYLQPLGNTPSSGTSEAGTLPLKGLSAGFGFRLGKTLGMDYAVVPFKDLGSAHRFSLSWKF